MIDVHDATKRIKGATVLDCVNMTVPAGAIVGLAGVNGSGKTMLLRALAGLIKLDEGFVEIEGKRLREDVDFPPSIGLLIENPAFLDSRTGRENLRIIALVGSSSQAWSSRAKEQADDAAVQALELVGLDPDDKRKFRKYSLGMKQRLGLAAAVMGWPRLVLLDEPTNALDRAGVARFEDIMGMLRERGSTVVLASHDASLLERHADVVYLIESGRIADADIMPRKGASHA
ncbi:MULTISPECIES: ATP-binding cassette domain-containing protein [unclassified Adlercreutzia]|uniref:ATP-binding cassette domain-containing protein n=1 Tax=unclassified Adlercreutzia TaxID=2636013 RepID=UPI0013EB4869|nr:MULTISPECIES: ATP-binding cassette domain-containing protein [unclassified Adlercreutzia]